jgi:membrane protein DedA with SNARE-associated domain
MEKHLLDLIARYGAFALFFVQMFGIFGLPIPDELLLALAGAAVRKGELGPIAVMSSAVGGCITGMTLSFVLGRTLGRRTLRHLPRVPDELLGRVQRWMRRLGRWFLAFGYFVPGVRHVTAITAGGARLSFGVFAAYAYPGAVLWCSVFLVAGYVAGEHWQQFLHDLQRHAAVAAAIAVALAASYLLVRRSRAGGSCRTTSRPARASRRA